MENRSTSSVAQCHGSAHTSQFSPTMHPAMQSHFSRLPNADPRAYGFSAMYNTNTQQHGAVPVQQLLKSHMTSPSTPLNETSLQQRATLPLAAPRYAPQHPQHPQLLYHSDYSSSNGRAGPLPMTSNNTMERYLLSTQTQARLPQSATLSQVKPMCMNYNLTGNSQVGQSRFPTSYSASSYVTDIMNAQQTGIGEVAEADSSTVLRDSSSHLNRKKRKACGRCGPCQRKDNCGTCMNCINRAKGKQICVFRKCEELKKKPSTGSLSDYSSELPGMRQDKRKEPIQLHIYQRKRSRSELNSETPVKLNPIQQHVHQQPTLNQQPVYTSLPETTLPRPYDREISEASTSAAHVSYLNSLNQAVSPSSSVVCSNQHPIPNTEQQETTDVISEALREIAENSDENSADIRSIGLLHPPLDFSPDKIPSTVYSSHSSSPGNLQLTQWNHKLSHIEPSPCLSRSSSDERAASLQQFYPNSNFDVAESDYKSNVSSQRLPDQLLSNLTHYNDFSTFQKLQYSALGIHAYSKTPETGAPSTECSVSTYANVNANLEDYTDLLDTKSIENPSNGFSLDLNAPGTSTEIPVSTPYSKDIRSAEDTSFQITYVDNTIPSTNDLGHLSGVKMLSSSGETGLRYSVPDVAQRVNCSERSNFQNNGSVAMLPQTPEYQNVAATGTMFSPYGRKNDCDESKVSTENFIPKLPSNVHLKDSYLHSYSDNRLAENLNEASSKQYHSALLQHHRQQLPDFQRNDLGMGSAGMKEIPWPLYAQKEKMHIAPLEQTQQQFDVRSPYPLTMQPHSSLHSPVPELISHSPSGNDTSPTFGHMPKLSPSPVPQSEGETASTGRVTNLSQTTHSSYTGTASILDTRVINNTNDSVTLNKTPNNYDSSSFLVKPGSSIAFEQNHPASLTQSVLKIPTPFNSAARSNIPKEVSVSMSLIDRQQFLSTSDNSSLSRRSSGDSELGLGKEQYFRPQAFNGRIQSDSRDQTASDTNTTISPGESGYDSADIHSQSSEPKSSQSSEERSSSSSQSAETGVKEKEFIEDKRSKNLFRAPADTLAAGNVSGKNSEGGCRDDLLTAGACTVTSNSFSITRTPILSNGASTDPYSKSGQILGPFNSENTRVLKDGLCRNKEDMLADNLLFTSRSRSTEYCKVGRDYQATNNQDHMSSHVCDLPQYKIGTDAITESCPQTPVRDNENEAGMKTSLSHVFPAVDTPPVTPHSMESSLKFGDFPLTTGGPNTNSLINMLPTPPYISDTAVQNCPPEFRHFSTETSRKFSTTNFEMPHQTACPNIDSLMPDSQTVAGVQASLDKKPTADEARNEKTDGISNKPNDKPLNPPCDCIKGTDGRNDDGPYYTHLGAAESIPAVRQLFEKRTGFSGAAIRIEKVIYSGKEGKTSRGCPIAKWIIRRSSEEEKVLVICRKRPGHTCQYAVTVIIIMLWEGVARPLADFAYANYSDIIPKNGEPTERRCGTNEDRTCACQGFNQDICGASFSFGCSWSMYYNGCKFARSNQPNKYKLAATKNAQAEKFVGKLCERLATVMSPIYKMAAPDAFHNQVKLEKEGDECRLGENTEEYSKPFSGVTACMDFCAHAHKDQHNMDSGSTLVVTLTKPELRKVGMKPADEQLHVLPLYKLDVTDEQGGEEGLEQKIASGAVEILEGFRRQVRLYVEPRLTKKQKAKAKKKPNRRSAAFDDVFSPPAKRGRPPKRSRSFENLHVTSASPNILHKPSVNMSSQYSMQLHNNSPLHPRFQTPPEVQRRFSSQPFTHHHLSFSQANPSAVPNHNDFIFAKNGPTLWPYRRHSNVEPVPQHQHQQQKPEPLPSAGSPATNEHLPSIGSFFTNNAVPNSPMTPDISPMNTPAPQSPNVPAGPGFPPQPKSSLPSIEDVVSHPFHETFSVVKQEPNLDLRVGATSIAARDATAAQLVPPQNLATMVNHNITTPQKFPYKSTIHSEERFRRESTTPDNGRSPPVAQTPQMPQSHAAEESFVFSDSEENFLDSDIGGVAIAPGHGSVLIECAYRELHATTPLLHPNRFYPSRISLVFYQHKSLNCRNHGAAEYEEKEEKRQQQREEKKMEELKKQQMSKTLQQPNHIDPVEVAPPVQSLPAMSLPKQNQFPHIPSVGYMREVKIEPTNDRDPFKGIPAGRQHQYPSYNNPYGWGSPQNNRTSANHQTLFPNHFYKRSTEPLSPLRPPCHSDIMTRHPRPYLPTDLPHPRNSVPCEFGQSQQKFLTANYERHSQYPNYSYPSIEHRYMQQQQTNRDIAMQYASAKTYDQGFLSNTHQYKSSGMSPWPVHTGILQVPQSIPQGYNGNANTPLHYGTAPHNGMASFHSQSLNHPYLPTATQSHYIHPSIAQYTGMHSLTTPYSTQTPNSAYDVSSQASFMPNALR